MPTLANLLIAAIVLVGAWQAWGIVNRRHARADAVAETQGGEADALRKLTLRSGGLFGRLLQNSLSPRLSILPAGLCFTVFVEQDWPFTDISCVDLPRTLSGTAIAFAGSRGTLIASVADRAAAQRVLRALPPTLPLTARAVALRDGG